jgi:hypothetical protein
LTIKDKLKKTFSMRSLTHKKKVPKADGDKTEAGEEEAKAEETAPVESLPEKAEEGQVSML